MKLKTILLKLFPYVAGFICLLAIIIFVLVQMSALGWYAVLTTLVVIALLIWQKVLVEQRADARISRDELRILEDRVQSIEDQIDELMCEKRSDEENNPNE